MPIFKTSGVLVVAVCIGFIASLIAEGEGQWLLMSRHGDCVEIGMLKRKIPDLGEINDPYSFIKLMRQKGYEVISNEVAGITGKGFEVRVPGKGLFLMFVTSEMYRGSGPR
jgi:hypothetical protein